MKPQDIVWETDLSKTQTGVEYLATTTSNKLIVGRFSHISGSLWFVGSHHPGGWIKEEIAAICLINKYKKLLEQEELTIGFSSKIKIWRQAAGLSREKLSKLSGVWTSTIKKIEEDPDTVITSLTAECIFGALGKVISWEDVKKEMER